ncbi:loricrin-like [Panicum virgatum]|uniref:Uncharacterized protein n=1 Tax=Panicum virgatum TaxID=38727 RepID=A0A8T0U950_PANVG|nr:loricrin-like [Panicum virgatum]KAG2618365.1 hypothetical protein PVAP13_3NG079546 [Panicum virgatum]
MALVTRRPGSVLLVGLLAPAAALGGAHAARAPAALHKDDDAAAAPAHQGQAPATAPFIGRAVDERAQEEHASEEVMSLSAGGGSSRSGGGSGGGSRSSGGGGGGARSGGGSTGGGGGSRSSGGGSRGGSRSAGGSRGSGTRSRVTTYYGDEYDCIDCDDYSAAGGRGGVWKAGVAATALAAAWLLQL